MASKREATHVRAIAERARNQFRTVAAPRFTECEFIGYIASWAGVKSGGLQVTLVIEASEKYQAMPLTDAAGEVLLFRVEQVFDAEEETREETEASS